MKTLFFLGFTNPFPGAAWTRIGFFAKYFRRKGHKVDIVGIFSIESLDEARSSVWDGIRIFNICPTSPARNFSSMLFNVFSSILILTPFFYVLRPEFVVISVPPGEPALGAYVASKLSGAKIIFDYRDEWEDYELNMARSRLCKEFYRLLKRVMIPMYNKSEFLVTVTPNLARSLRSRGVRKVKLIPNGADIAVFKPYNKSAVRRKLGLNNDDFVIVYNGVRVHYYRLDVVVKALANLRTRIENVKLVAVGFGPDLPRKLKEEFNNFGVSDRVICLGLKFDKKELAEVLSAGDVGVIPYDDNPLWKNALPAKFFEYCACGMPVVATVYEDSILAELIKKYKIGLTAPPLDQEKLAEAIYRIYEHGSFREAGGKKARLLVKEKFERNKISNMFLSLMEQVAS